MLREVSRAPGQKKTALLAFLEGRSFQVLPTDELSETLADKYIEEKIVPDRYRDDALHIAIASVHNLDVIVSWNFEHLVKVKTRREVQGVNTMMGYRTIDIAPLRRWLKMKEPRPMREIHEIQEALYEEEKGLSRKERIAKIHREAKELMDQYGLQFKTVKKAA